jgi:hypothetical protein
MEVCNDAGQSQLGSLFLGLMGHRLPAPAVSQASSSHPGNFVSQSRSRWLAQGAHGTKLCFHACPAA